MARMIPPHVTGTDVPPGEQKIFGKLKNSSEARDWIVLHSLDLADHSHRVSGEVDFVVVIPKKGVLCLEVKSHRRIKCKNGRWFFGHEEEELRSPFTQIRDAMHDLRRHFQKENPDLSSVVFWSGVVFPYVDFSQRSPEWHDWQVVDREKIRSTGVVGSLTSMIMSARKHLEDTPSATWFEPEDTLPKAEDCERIIDTFRPDFEVHQSPKSRAEDRRSEILRYTQKQYRALDTMGRNPRVVFTGPAGTGKTTLAIEAARRQVSEGKNVLFTCFNRYLGDWIADQLHPLENLSVGTLHSQMLQITGLDPHDRSDRFWKKKLPKEAAVQAINKELEYDSLIIDEAQDLMRETYLNFLDTLTAGGFQNGRWRLFGDFTHQNIYSGSRFSEGEKFVSLESFINSYDVPVYSLSENCRNTPRIAGFVESLAQMNPGYSKLLRRDNGVDPDVRLYENGEGKELLVNILETLCNSTFRDEDIVVLQPSLEKDPLGGVRDGKDFDQWCKRLREYSEQGEGYVRYSTIHAFKGLEAPAVVVSGFDNIDRPKSRELFYVATSRAQNKLVVLAPKEAGNEMMKIMAGC